MQNTYIFLNKKSFTRDSFESFGVYFYTYFYLDFLIIQYFHIVLFSFFLIHNVL